MRTNPGRHWEPPGQSIEAIIMIFQASIRAVDALRVGIPRIMLAPR
jgi:hypothetical protein